MSEDPWKKLLAEAKEGTFPGGGVTPNEGELRVAVDKAPYAEVIGHSIEEPEVEICGVLVGYLRKDSHGPFVHITSIIRGEKALKEGAQVTFTHDTWDHIHKELDANPDKEQRILGWYHTHGGFGIFLSEMDTFIHENFFPEPFHLAYVYDPLAGSEGFFRREGGEFRQHERYWIGGKPRKVFMRAEEPEEPAPGAAGSGSSAGGAGGESADLRAVVGALNRTVAGLQSSMPHQDRTDPGTISLAMLGIAAAIGFLAGSILSPQLTGRGGGSSPRAVVVVHKDPATGREFGLEVFPMAREEGAALPLYRDAKGDNFYGVELRPLDSSQSVIASAIPDALAKGTAPPQPEGKGSRSGLNAYLYLAGALALILVILGAAGAMIWRSRRTPL